LFDWASGYLGSNVLLSINMPERTNHFLTFISNVSPCDYHYYTTVINETGVVSYEDEVFDAYMADCSYMFNNQTVDLRFYDLELNNASPELIGEFLFCNNTFIVNSDYFIPVFYCNNSMSSTSFFTGSYLLKISGESETNITYELMLEFLDSEKII
jgi:hypothetical protein